MQNKFPKDIENTIRNQGIDPKNFKSSDAQKLMSSLNREDAQKLNSILQNKQALNDILNSPQAKSLMQSLFGEK